MVESRPLVLWVSIVALKDLINPLEIVLPDTSALKAQNIG